MRIFLFLLLLNPLFAIGANQIQTAAIANGAVTNAKMANSSSTISGQSCALGSSCTVPFSGLSGTANVPDLSMTNTFVDKMTLSRSGGSGIPAFYMNGSPYASGNATTNKAMALIEDSGNTSTGWSVAGTYLGINSAAAFAGNIFDLQANGTSVFNIFHDGTITDSKYGAGILQSSSGGVISSSSALASGTTATTQSAADNSTKVATTAYADRMLPLAGGTMSGQFVAKGITEKVVAGGTCSTSYNVDPTAGTDITVTLNGACAIGVTNLAAGHSFTIYVSQSSTTAPTFTSAYKWASGVTPSFSASSSKYDTIACGSPDGSKLICGAIIDGR